MNTISPIPVRVLIVDDELAARKLMNQLLLEFCENVEVVGACGSVDEALVKVSELQPDVIFLDIQMPNKTGFDLVAHLPDEEDCAIVFVTAYDEHAIRAFEVAAVDYLLKPVGIQSVQKAVERVRARLQQVPQSSSLAVLRENMKSLEKIGLVSKTGVEFERVADIIMLVADGGYTHVHLVGGRVVLVSKPLGRFEELLGENDRFYRPHRSYLINFDHMKTYLKGESILVMSGGLEARLARFKRADFEALVEGLTA